MSGFWPSRPPVLGLPDTGFDFHSGEMLDSLRKLFAAVASKIPLIRRRATPVTANALNVQRTVVEYARAGWPRPVMIERPGSAPKKVRPHGGKQVDCRVTRRRMKIRARRGRRRSSDVGYIDHGADRRAARSTVSMRPWRALPRNFEGGGGGDIIFLEAPGDGRRECGRFCARHAQGLCMAKPGARRKDTGSCRPAAIAGRSA